MKCILQKVEQDDKCCALLIGDFTLALLKLLPLDI